MGTTGSVAWLTGCGPEKTLFKTVNHLNQTGQGLTMAELDASKLPGDASKELRGFLEKKLSVKIKEAGGKITVENVSNTRLRKAVRWFLCKKGLSEEYRVLADGKSLTVRKRK